MPLANFWEVINLDGYWWTGDLYRLPCRAGENLLPRLLPPQRLSMPLHFLHGTRTLSQQPPPPEELVSIRWLSPPSTFSSIFPSISQFVYSAVHPSICPSVHLSICLSVHLFIHRYIICSPVNLFMLPSIHPFICLSIHQSIHYMCWLVCDLCCANIRENEEDAIHCENACRMWYHRYCIGVSKSQFQKFVDSDTPFVCQCCSMALQAERITQLESLVSSFTGEVSELKAA